MSSKYDDDDDAGTVATAPKEDEKVTPEDASVRQAAARVIKRGWGNAEAVNAAGSPFAQRLTITDDAKVIKFLEDDPYTSYRQHWIERQGQKSFTCTDDMDPRGCPLCKAGNRPSARFAFNVAVLQDGEEPVLKSYEVGPRIIDSLKNFHLDPRQGPLTKNYWAVSKTGKGATSQTNHQMVRERDLETDWELAPITEEQIAALKKSAYGASIVSIPTRKTLQTIAAEELA